MPITYTLQGKTDKNIDSYSLFFTGHNRNPIVVGQYQAQTVLKDGNDYVHLDSLPNNVQYVSATTANWRQGVELLTQLENDQATIKVTATFEIPITITQANLYVYEANQATAPENMTVYAVEAGQSTWQNIGGSDNALTLSAKEQPATTHEWYVALSATPTTNGVQSGIVLLTSVYYA